MRKGIRRLVIRAGLLFMVLPLCLAVNVQAASFDCAKASTKVEKIICDNPEISKLDDELSASYKAALQNEKQAESIRHAQKQWMKERNICIDADCVKRAYEIRLSSLTIKQTAISDGVVIKQKVVPSTQRGSWTYRGGAGRNEPLCRELLKRLNRYEWNESQDSRCSWDVIASYPEFSEPPWEELDSKQYEDLIFKLTKYGQETPEGYFHRLSGLKEMAPDRVYRNNAKEFIKYGGRLQVWRTKLSAFNPTNPKRDSISAGEQTIIRMSGGFPRRPPSKELDEKINNTCKGMPRVYSHGEIFYVTSDLSGPDPAVETGTFGIISGHDLRIYQGKPIFVGFQTIWRDSPSGLNRDCNFEFVKGEK